MRARRVAVCALTLLLVTDTVSARNNTIREAFPDVFSELPAEFDAGYKNPCWKTDGVTKCLPYYQILGVSKCGTTDLYSRMIAHPDIYDIKNKGPHWWDEDKKSGIATYLNLFSTAAKGIESNRAGITGEASSNTLSYSGVGIRGWRHAAPEARGILLPELLREALPNQRNIVILRNPIDRLYSSFYYYRDWRARGPPREGEFEEEVNRVLTHWGNCVARHPEDHCARSLYFLTQQLNKGMYASFLEQWYQTWPRESFLVLRAEDYYKDIRGGIVEVLDFLGVREPTPLEWDRILAKATKNQRATNKGKGAGAGPMAPATRARLAEFYRPFNERLARLTGERRWSEWR